MSDFSILRQVTGFQRFEVSGLRNASEFHYHGVTHGVGDFGRVYGAFEFALGSSERLDVGPLPVLLPDAVLEVRRQDLESLLAVAGTVERVGYSEVADVVSHALLPFRK